MSDAWFLTYFHGLTCDVVLHCIHVYNDVTCSGFREVKQELTNCVGYLGSSNTEDVLL